MRDRSSLLLTAALSVSIVFFNTEVFADSSIGISQGDIEIVVNKRQEIRHADISFPSSSQAVLRLQNDNAYSCVLENPPTGVALNFGPYSVFAAALDDDTKFDTVSEFSALNVNATRQVVSFSQPALEDRFVSISPDINIPNGLIGVRLIPSGTTTGSTSVSYITCYSNTHRGSYNTNATPVNILELRNTSAGQIRVYVNAKNSAGQQVVSRLRLDLAAGSEQHLLLHELVGANEYGSIQVSWQGAPRALNSSISRYSVGQSGLEFKGTTPLISE